jgi:hypothetical protein
MIRIVSGAVKGAAIGFAISVVTVSFIAGPESAWDWPAGSRWAAAMFSLFFSVIAAAAGAAFSDNSK